MNALALWLPGTALIVLGAALFASGRLDWTPALAVIAIGVAVETAGVIVWLRQRRNARR